VHAKLFPWGLLEVSPFCTGCFLVPPVQLQRRFGEDMPQECILQVFQSYFIPLQPSCVWMRLDTLRVLYVD